MLINVDKIPLTFVEKVFVTENDKTARWQVLRPEHSLKSKSNPDGAASKADRIELLLSTLSRFSGT